MKKNNIGTKGFVMSELLAASIVILLLFTILFANYLPLVAEFENRSLYNNVTANYGLFYVRKAYSSVLKDNTVKETLNTGLQSKSFYTIYKQGTIEEPQLITDQNMKSQLLDIISEYNIEEIIITRYKLDDVKGKSGQSNPPVKYEKSDGSLYKYISYLPLYKKSQYGTDQLSEPYRLIMKTKDFGYATTPIIPNPATPISCFSLGKISEGKFAILDYDDEKCEENVTVTSEEIVYNNQRGIITAITGNGTDSNYKGAFEGKGIKSLQLSKNITYIGDKAFKDNNIRKFSFEDNAPGVTEIGESSFSNNKLKSITIPRKINIANGKYAFANNKLLEIVFEDTGGNNEITIPNNMFSQENANEAGNSKIDLFIPYYVTAIGESAFKNLQLSSIDFEDGEDEESKPSQLVEIKPSAFETKYINDDNFVEISIPNTVTKIGSSAFKNVKVGSFVFKTDDNGKSALQDIGNSAFEVYDTNTNNIDKEKFCTQRASEDGTDENTPCIEYIRNVKIPTNVEKIGSSAFKNQALSVMIFEETDENGVTNNKSKLINIGDEALSGNSFSSITIPESLFTSRATVGKNIFGTGSYSLGNNMGEITIIKAIFDNNTWCNIFYGSTCTATEYVDESDEGEDDTTQVYMYKQGSTTKYVTYFE